MSFWTCTMIVVVVGILCFCAIMATAMIADAIENKNRNEPS